MDIYELDTHLRELTPHQLKMVEALYNASGTWLTRAQIARAINKRRLTPYDIECLSMLTERRIISTSTRPTTAPGSDFAYIYNLPDEMAELLHLWSENREQLRAHNLVQRKPLNLF